MDGRGSLRREARGIAVLGLAAIFFSIGFFFLLAPDGAALFFGTAPPEGGIGRLYVRAIGARDIGLAVSLAGLVALGRPRATAFVLGAFVAVPICDVALVASASGLSAWPSLVAHVGAGVVLALLAWWCARAR